MTFSPALAAVIKKEIVQTVRDKRVVAILVVAPLVQLVVLGYAVDLDVNHVPMVIADQDLSPESRALSEGLTAGDTFDELARVSDPEAAASMLYRGEASAVVVIPAGHARDLAAGRAAQIQVLADGTDTNRAIVSQNAAAAYVLRRALTGAESRYEAAARARGAAVNLPRVSVEPRIFYNPHMESTTFFVPGVAATLLLIVSLVVTAMGLAREKETGTLEQILVTPIRPSVLIAGKTLPYGVVALMDLGLVLAGAMLVFDVPLRGSIPLLFFGGTLYLFAILGIGLFVSTIARNQQQAFMTSILFIMPAILLSGFMTPVANMPHWLQVISAFDPVRHFIEILRAVMLKQAGWGDVASQLVALGGIGAVVFPLSVVAMSRRLG